MSKEQEKVDSIEDEASVEDRSNERKKRISRREKHAIL